MPNGGRWSYTSVRVSYPVGSRGLLFTVLLPHGISHHCSSKIATIYTPNYIFLFFHRNIWRKYVILSAFLQPIDIQHIATTVVYLAPRISSCALRLGVFRLAIHA